MLVLVVVLVATNVLTLVALAVLYRFVDGRAADGPDALAAAALDAAPAPSASAASSSGTRRLITVEVLNPIELAGTKGRLAGLAGSIAPRLTRRIVNEQVLKILREQLIEQQVDADVRLHTLRRGRPTAPDGPQTVTDEVAPMELSDRE